METLQHRKKILPLKILVINFSKILWQMIESSIYFEIHELIKGYNRPGQCGSIRGKEPVGNIFTCTYLRMVMKETCMIGSSRTQQWSSALGKALEPSSCSSQEVESLRIRGTNFAVEIQGRRPGSSLECCWYESTLED